MINQYPQANNSTTSLIWRKTMSGGETSVSGYDDGSQTLSYTPGQEHVYLNGILLLRGTDYTATNGTSITGLSALAESDIVQVNAYNNFNLTTSLPATNIYGSITNSQLENSAISINGSSVSLGGTATISAVPSQTGNSGKYLTTDGTTASWGTVTSYSAPTLGSTAISSGSTVSNINGLTINSTTIPTSKTLVATDSSTYVVPSQTGNSGKYLTTDGTTASWGTVASSPILSVNYGQRTTSWTSTSTTLSLVTGMSVTLTPKSTSSKFIIFVNTQFNVKGSQSFCAGAVYRNGTLVGTYSTQQGFDGTSASQKKLSWSDIQVDAPATTSSVTYEFRAGSGSAGLGIELENQSAIIVMEI